MEKEQIREKMMLKFAEINQGHMCNKKPVQSLTECHLAVIFH